MSDITSQVIWISSNTNIATILSNGSATGVAGGTAIINRRIVRDNQSTDNIECGVSVMGSFMNEHGNYICE